MKTIGILGTGRMALRLGTLLADRGHAVTLGSRAPARARALARAMRRPGITGGAYGDAAALPVVLPAMFLRDGLLDTLEPHRAALAGKLLIDITNPFNDRHDDFILPWDTSGAEELQRRFPAARVVGAFKNVWWEVFDKPMFDGAPSDVYVVSDDENAKQEFFALVDGSPFRYVDAGETRERAYRRADDALQRRARTALRLLPAHELAATRRALDARAGGSPRSPSRVGSGGVKEIR